MQTPITTTTPEVKTEQDRSEAWIRVIPPELANLMPETAWASLSLEDKKDILRKNNLFEKYVGSVEQVAPPVAEAVTEVAPQVKAPEVVVESTNVSIPEAEQFKEQVEKAKELEKSFEQENKLDVDEQARVNEEKAVTANTQQNRSVRVFGYSVSPNTTQNANKISDEGDLSEGKTWAATLIKKIFAMFG